MNSIIEELRSGRRASKEISQFRRYINDIEVCAKVVKYNGSVVVPKVLRIKILKILRQGHTGITGMCLGVIQNVRLGRHNLPSQTNNDG